MEDQDRLRKIFPNADVDEEVLIFTRKHWFMFLIIFIIIFAMHRALCFVDDFHSFLSAIFCRFNN